MKNMQCKAKVKAYLFVEAVPFFNDKNVVQRERQTKERVNHIVAEKKHERLQNFEVRTAIGDNGQTLKSLACQSPAIGEQRQV